MDMMICCAKCGYPETAGVHQPVIGGTDPWGHAFQATSMTALTARVLRERGHREHQDRLYREAREKSDK